MYSVDQKDTLNATEKNAFAATSEQHAKKWGKIREQKELL